ncbi:hypothetical protein ACH5RR_014356 [Cinchona calisaya]|uniref:Uncharacterized protein n=1 Tax=Cinchona calisaya TaxID=153742 RepID=A0ABD3A2Q2_9GENT
MVELEKKKHGQLQAMWFAAGTAAFMACLERAVLVSFVEQWRVVVFLALNLLLLAILFTSPSPPASSNEPTSQESYDNVDFKVEGRNKRKDQCTSRPSMISEANDDNDEDCMGDRLKFLKCRSKRENHEHVIEKKILEDTTKNQAHELSKEELNERAEAFITMFRQHLVSDAKGKSCRVNSSSIKRKAMYNSHSGRMGKGF